MIKIEVLFADGTTAQFHGEKFEVRDDVAVTIDLYSGRQAFLNWAHVACIGLIETPEQEVDHDL